MAKTEKKKLNIGNLIVQNPKIILFFGIITLVSLTSGILKLEKDFTYRSWFHETNPNLQAFDTFESRFGNDDIIVISIGSQQSIFNKNSIEFILDFTDKLWTLPDVIRVDSLSNYRKVYNHKDEVHVEPFLSKKLNLDIDSLEEKSNIARLDKNLTNYLISKDQKTTMFYISLEPAIDKKSDYTEINLAIQKLVNEYRSNQKYSNYKYHIAGGPVLTFSFEDASQTDMKNLIPFVVLITIFFLFFFFRNLTGILSPILVITSTVLATMGFAGWVGIKINVMTAIVPQFLIALSVAVVVHILVSIFQFKRLGETKEFALNLALNKNWTPTLLTSISTAIGFFSFSNAAMANIAELGILAGVGTLLSWLFTYFLIAPILTLFPIKWDIDLNKISNSSQKNISKNLPQISINFIDRWKYFIIFLFLGLGSCSLFFAFKTQVSSDPFDYFDKKYPLSKAMNFIEKRIGGAIVIDTIVESGANEGIKNPTFLKNVQDLQNWIDNHSFISKSNSIIDILKEVNKALEGGDESNYKLAAKQDLISQQILLYSMNLPLGMDLNNRLTQTNDALRITSMTTLHRSDLFMNFVTEIEEYSKTIGLNAWVTGKGPLYQSANGLIVSSFRTSLFFAIFFVSLLLFIGLKSYRLGLISIVPNTMPLILGSGLLYLYGASLDIGTVLIGSICLGIAVDDTIHFLADYTYFKNNGVSAKEALTKVFTFTVPALLTTTTVLVTSFGCFIFATFQPNQNFGMFVAIILSIALLADLTLLPAILLIVDKEASAQQNQ